MFPATMTIPIPAIIIVGAAAFGFEVVTIVDVTLVT